ncbi:hypothetical protein E2562_036382 [Oryza meyeriana var. granulata]|uniref:Uncharacterized protein n=1 Tax=Oryza meyeriana var. granulata TaxID=110450 RepID=A0A6G1F211_9ORYZ|nr:hypothetical protein E2562_036382 [Oryza meyeriana var. granulata]
MATTGRGGRRRIRGCSPVASEVHDADGGLRPSSDGRRWDDVGVWAAAAAARGGAGRGSRWGKTEGGLVGCSPATACWGRGGDVGGVLWWDR